MALRPLVGVVFLAWAGEVLAQAPHLSPAGVALAPRSLSQTPPNQLRTPPLEPARVAGQVMAGAYAGIGGYVLGTLVGSLVMERVPMASEGTREQVSFALGLVGATFATAGTVSTVGSIGDQTGNYSYALVGTAGGVAAGLLLNQVLYGRAWLPEQKRSSRVRWIEASLEALLPSIGATIAFNSTRRYK